MTLMLGMGEVTNPLLSLMEFTKFFNWGPPLSVIIQLSFVFSFILLRGPGAFIVFQPFYTSDANFYFKLFVAGIWVISMNYVWITLNMAIKIAYQVSCQNFNFGEF